MRQRVRFGSAADGPGGVLVRPDSGGRAPVVLITTAIAGVNEYVLRQAERLAGRPAEIYTCPGAGHAFHEDFRAQVYRPVAAVTAWSRTREYLPWYLPAQSPPQGGRDRIPS
jgi:dienelactone hydrolase